MSNSKSTQPFSGLELVESRTLRSRHRDRTDALDKVKGLATLPGNELATVKQVAEFYEVPVKTIDSVIEDNRTELEANGYRTLIGAELAPFKGGSYVGLRARSLAVFTRTAVLNVGMLLTNSEVARQVRTYLLTVEATATTDHRLSSVELVRLQERQDFKLVLHSLKLGGAQSGDDYQLIQNTLYLGLFGKTAAQIRASQKQRCGVPLKRGEGFRKSTVAKDYLTEDQLTILNNTVLISVGQLNIRHPKGATVAQMLGVVNNSVALAKDQRQVGGAA